jgi:hypothetical protein
MAACRLGVNYGRQMMSAATPAFPGSSHAGFSRSARSRFEACATFEAKRRFLREHVGRIAFHKGRVAITGSIPAHGAPSERDAQYRIEGEIDGSKVRLKTSRMLWKDERLTSWVPETSCEATREPQTV